MIVGTLADREGDEVTDAGGFAHDLAEHSAHDIAEEFTGLDDLDEGTEP